MASFRVLLVEDHPAVQIAIQDLLHPCCTVVATLDRTDRSADAIRTLQPDVLILDVSLPGRSGLEVLPELREGFPSLGIVVATSHSQPVYRQEAFRRGADAFVVKSNLKLELWAAVQEAYSARRSRHLQRASRQA